MTNKTDVPTPVQLTLWAACAISIFADATLAAVCAIRFGAHPAADAAIRRANGGVIIAGLFSNNPGEHVAPGEHWIQEPDMQTKPSPQPVPSTADSHVTASRQAVPSTHRGPLASQL